MGPKPQGARDRVHLPGAPEARATQPKLPAPAAQRCRNHLHRRSTALGKPSRPGIPGRNTSPPETTATGGAANLSKASVATHEHTRTRCKQQWEHPVPGSLGGREVSKGEGQEKRCSYSATTQDLGFVFFTQASSSHRCRAASARKAGMLGETTWGQALLPPCQPWDGEVALGLGWPTSPSALASRGAGEARGCQLSPLSEKKLKEAPGPQLGAPLLISEFLWLFTGLFLFHTDCDKLRARGKVPTR